jgi:branched-chain amino acid transport system permease protein
VGAYALIALGLTLIFGTLGVVNFAHGALFMLGAFCAVTLQRSSRSPRDDRPETEKDFLGNPLKVDVPYVQDWFGTEVGGGDHRLVRAAVDPVGHSGHGLSA